MAVNSTETETRQHVREAAPAPPQTWHEHRDLPVAGSRPPSSASAADVVLAYLRLQAHELRSLEPMARADTYDAVHQMRVATRRLRATLRSFGQVIPRSDTERLAGELKWLGGLLGAARDGEVLGGHLRESLRSVPVELLIGPVQARVQGHFAPLRAAAHAELLEGLDSPRYAALLAELDRLTLGPLSGPKASAPARYAAEAARPAAGRKARRFARQMKKVQSVLGDHQDAVLARQAARDLGIGAHLAGENAFTYGLLHERERHRARRRQAGARTAWRRASRP